MACSCSGPESTTPNPGYRKALWFALWMNLAMFFVEGIASVQSDSVSLLADAIDFFGDSANYILSLSVLSMGLLWRSYAALIKGLTMATFGIAVWIRGLWIMQSGITPEAITMGTIGLLALIANVSVAMVLFRYRSGDADMRSVWLCSRNDAISNVAVMVAAIGVFGTQSAWPDLIVAGIMGTLAITAGVSVIRHARQEISKNRITDTCPSTPE